ncbi:MAG: ketoacyl-ACP synthase III [Fimbriimonadaceae bacterium]|jgi:3-oxoacyl-[acyl-carrier-protein] synthase-3|nr:ketoacyl-ACP synthase III [Fimbriimonadaceae bacterium]
MSIRAVICGTGHSVPEKILTNDDLSQMVDTNDEWITQRTGIRERRICSSEESCSTLSIQAAKEAIASSGIPPQEIDLVVLATVTGDYVFPATASLVQSEVGAVNAGAFDVQAACAGFIYSLSVAEAMIKAGTIRTALVLGVDTLSKFVDWTDRSTCVLFGDAAGAVVVRGETDTDRGVIKTVLLSDGTGAPHIKMEVGGSKHPFQDVKSRGLGDYIYMNGAEVYRFAVNAMGDACCKCLEEAGMDVSEVDLFVPHQANLRIIQSAAKRLGLADEKVFVNVDRYGNTSAGSIPLGLYEAEKSGRLKRGDVVMTVGFGAGLVWGANVIRW